MEQTHLQTIEVMVDMEIDLQMVQRCRSWK